MLQNILINTQLKQNEKQRFSTVLSRYKNGDNELTEGDLNKLKSAMAIGNGTYAFVHVNLRIKTNI